MKQLENQDDNSTLTLKRKKNKIPKKSQKKIH